MIKTYAIKWDEKILVNSENKDSLVWYEFIQEEYPSEEHFNKIQAWYSYNIETELFEESPESIEFEKQVDISKFKELEKKATEKRAEYLTTELLPEWTFRDLKLAKLFDEWEVIKAEYEAMMTELATKYWESILNELI